MCFHRKYEVDSVEISLYQHSDVGFCDHKYDVQTKASPLWQFTELLVQVTELKFKFEMCKLTYGNFFVEAGFVERYMNLYASYPDEYTVSNQLWYLSKISLNGPQNRLWICSNTGNISWTQSNDFKAKGMHVKAWHILYSFQYYCLPENRPIPQCQQFCFKTNVHRRKHIGRYALFKKIITSRDDIYV